MELVSIRRTAATIATLTCALCPSAGANAATPRHHADREGPRSSVHASTRNPFAGQRFYVEPNSQAEQTEREWSAQGRSREAALIAKIAGQPSAEWFGDWSYGHGDTAEDVNWWITAAAAAGTLPVIVAYDLPWRDCGLYSSGGAASATAYRQFIDEMAQGIAGRTAVVILEPDALAELTCLNAEQQASYYSLLSYAVARLAESPAVSVYLDAGQARWRTVATIARRLKKADVARARGFSLNVDHVDTTASERRYGHAIVKALGGGHFIVDTSRNGRGPAARGQWCNPPGRGLGSAPTAVTGDPEVDAYFWVKPPGESDGTCNGGPPAGQWWPAYALSLAQNAIF
jgi:endoglucanase